MKSLVLSFLIFIALPCQAEQLQLYFPKSELSYLSPERGFFQFLPLTSATDFSQARTRGSSLAYAELDLSNFRNSDISSERLEDIKRAFQLVREAGLKVILRVVYSHGTREADTTMQQMGAHLKQLGPLFQNNKELIFAIQGGFIGAWGEWHSSSHKLELSQSRNELIGKLLKTIPGSIPIQLRRPQFKLDFLSKTSKPSTKKRLGHHNDCLLADRTDANTYNNREMQQQKQSIAQDSKVTVIGGETCKASQYTNCRTAISELKRLGFTYLNRQYHPEVIQQWINDGCFTEIEGHLGYRFEITSGELTVSPSTIEGKIFVQNTGYAPMYSKRKVILVVIDDTDSVISSLTVPDSSLTGLLPGKAIPISFSFSLNPLLIGKKLSFGISLPDSSEKLENDPRYSVRFANPVRWNETRGLNIIASDIQVPN